MSERPALPALEPRDPGDRPLAPPPLPAASAPRLTSPAAVGGRLAPSGQGRQLRAQVTAYSASVEEGTAWGITRSGTRARPGVVAVDPRVIPLGSRVRIAGLPGVYRAEDTGGGIIGAHVDVFMESRADALRFGRQTSVLIVVLD
jgi:3D (Asp-Asp-Asp) domain-containing protein